MRVQSSARFPRPRPRRWEAVPVPQWVKAVIDAWISAAQISDGRLFRCVSHTGVVWGDSVTQKGVWRVVRRYRAATGIPNFAPHDCRRTCARLCHVAGEKLEQIQFLLGHRSVKTTERYLDASNGCNTPSTTTSAWKRDILRQETAAPSIVKREGRTQSEMGRQVAIVLYVVAMAAVIVGVDFVFFRNRFWERLIANIGIVLLFAAFYLRFLRRP